MAPGYWEEQTRALSGSGKDGLTWSPFPHVCRVCHVHRAGESKDQGQEMSKGLGSPGHPHREAGPESCSPSLPPGPIWHPQCAGVEATGGHFPAELGPGQQVSQRPPPHLLGAALPHREAIPERSCKAPGSGSGEALSKGLLAASGARRGQASRPRCLQRDCLGVAGWREGGGFCQLFGVTKPGCSGQAAARWAKGLSQELGPSSQDKRIQCKQRAEAKPGLPLQPSQATRSTGRERARDHVPLSTDVNQRPSCPQLNGPFWTTWSGLGRGL